MAATDEKIVLGLDVPKTVKQINADIKKLQNQLAQVKATGALDTSSTVKKLNSQITALQSQLKTIDIHTEIDTDRVKKTAQQTGANIAQNIADGIRQSIDERLSDDDLKKVKERLNDSADTTKNSLSQSLSEGVKKLTSWIDAAASFNKTISTARQALLTIRDLDTALADLRKTSNLSASELTAFYHSANDTAKQIGVTTQSIIEQAAAWSKLGFHTADAAAQMARLSSQFQLLSPGMTSDEAISGLISTMKAYGIEVNEVLDGIMSKVNVIGDHFALSNTDIVAMLHDSAAAMAAGNNTLEETIALETAAFEIVQDRSVGSGFETAALRLRGINEETQELDDSLKTIKGDLYDLTGVSIMEDANTYKSTYQILKEMSDVWDSLTAQTQDEALALMFGKSGANIGASVLNNFSAAEKAMKDMADSAGNAEAEMSAAMDSIDYKLNKVKETGTGIAQNLFAREDMKSILDVISSLGNGLDWLTGKLGLLKSIGIGASVIAGAKGLGLTNYVTIMS